MSTATKRGRLLFLAACPACRGAGEVGCGVCGASGEAMSGEGGCPRCGGDGARACGVCDGSGEKRVEHVVAALVCSGCGEHIEAAERQPLITAWLDEHASCA